MLFNSLDFLLFFPIVCLLFFGLPQKFRWLMLLVASCYFYMYFIPIYILILAGTIVIDYFAGILIEQNHGKRRRFYLIVSLFANIMVLAVFKYYNFFAASFAEMFTSIGFKTSPILLNVILPVGISFYTFHGLSYVIDIYKDKIKVERNFIDYSLFVSFFPLLVAGPIERATHLLPQIKKKRTFDFTYAADGLRQILWGLFKKIVIADNCAIYANAIFNDSANHDGSSLFLGAIFFTFQIYGDFSGYSDIALGTSRLFGIEL